jgi:hypothetical protein
MNICRRTLSLVLLTAIAAIGRPAVTVAETFVERDRLEFYVGYHNGESSTLPIQVSAAAIDSAVKTEKFRAVKLPPPTPPKPSSSDDSKLPMLMSFPVAKPFDEWWSRWSIDDQLRTLELRYLVATEAIPLKEVKAAHLDEIFRVPEQVIDQGNLPLWGGSSEWVMTRKERHICARFVWLAQDKARQILGAYCLSSKVVPDGAAMLRALDIKFDG